MASTEFPKPTVMPVSRVQQILALTKESELMAEMAKFEDAIYEAGDPSRLLHLDVRSNDVANLLDHMTSVERWRERTTRWYRLATCFVYIARAITSSSSARRAFLTSTARPIRSVSWLVSLAWKRGSKVWSSLWTAGSISARNSSDLRKEPTTRSIHATTKKKEEKEPVGVNDAFEAQLATLGSAMP